jgi:hypothetical protein
MAVGDKLLGAEVELLAPPAPSVAVIYSGTAPICCMRVITSVTPQCSATFPSSTRMMSTDSRSVSRDEES